MSSTVEEFPMDCFCYFCYSANFHRYALVSIVYPGKVSRITCSEQEKHTLVPSWENFGQVQNCMNVISILISLILS